MNEEQAYNVLQSWLNDAEGLSESGWYAKTELVKELMNRLDITEEDL